MSLAVLAVLLDCVVHCDVLVEQELSVERLNGSIRSLKTVEGDECKSFWLATCRIPRHLWKPYDTTKCREGLVEQSFVDRWVETTDEQVGANINLFAVVGRFVDTDGLAVKLESVHDFACIVGILFGLELGKGIALVRLCDAVFGQVEVDKRTGLDHEFPDDGIGSAIVYVANVAGGILVAIKLGWPRHSGSRSALLMGTSRRDEVVHKSKDG